MSLLMLSYRGYASASLFHWTRPPSLRLSGKDKPVNMVRRGGGNKTKEYSRELKTVGLDSDPYDLPKNQWSTTDIKYMDILISVTFIGYVQTLVVWSSP